MEYLPGGFSLNLAEGCFPLSTDSMVLAYFTKLPRNARVLDLGSGCGTIGILLCAKDIGCNVTGIELDETAHQTALKNSKDNRLQSRLQSICGDFTQIADHTDPGSFDICVSNPPYFTAGFLSQTTPLARHEQSCSLELLMKSAAWALKFGGDFYLVHKPERRAEIFFAASSNKLQPKRLCLLRHKENGPVSLVLVQCRKGAKPGLTWEEAALHSEDGQPTAYYRQVYHL